MGSLFVQSQYNHSNIVLILSLSKRSNSDIALYYDSKYVLIMYRGIDIS